MYNVRQVEDIPRIWKTIPPLPIWKDRYTVEILYTQKTSEIRYKGPRISHAVSGIVPSLGYFIKNPDRVREKFNIFLLTPLSLSTLSEVDPLARRWYTVLYSIMLPLDKNTTSFIHIRQIAPIVRWETSLKMLEHYSMFLAIVM